MRVFLKDGMPDCFPITEVNRTSVANQEVDELNLPALSCRNQYGRRMISPRPGAKKYFGQLRGGPGIGCDSGRTGPGSLARNGL